MRAGTGDRGFTLIEILLSLALVAMILVALNTFVFSMGELWGKGTDVRLFDQHAAAVTRFLANELKAATLPPAARSNSTPVGIEQVSPPDDVAQNLITFDLPAGSRIFHWPDRPLPEVTCSLLVRDRQGLFLLWQSRLETGYGQDPPREILLSPLVEAISYDYYDDNFKRWVTETSFLTDSNGNPEIPQRLRLKFAYGNLTRETVVPVPAALSTLPNF